LFQGEELGQKQGELSYDQLHDRFDKIYWPDVVGRDGARCPFPWDDAQDQSGFTTSGSPWLPVGKAEDGGVAQQVGRDGSVLEFYRQAIKSRSQFGMSDREIEISAAEDDWFVARLLAKGEPDILLCANFGESSRDVPADLSGHTPLLASAKPLNGRLAPRSATWWQMD
jgi:alpha-glucosidase